VARALKGRTLATLRVRGVATAQDFLDQDSDGNRAAAMVAPELARLRKRLRPPHDLDATAGCTFVTQEAEHGYDDEEVCGRLCGEADRVCDSCDAYHCAHDAMVLLPEEEEAKQRCARCGARICDRCCEETVDMMDGDEQHVCGYCGARHCLTCIDGRRAVAFAACDVCGKGACDRCVRALRIPVWPAADDDSDGDDGLRFLCAECDE
jgi:hypothetical protein